MFLDFTPLKKATLHPGGEKATTVNPNRAAKGAITFGLGGGGGINNS
jgi:hypothetical protein